jgi:hypothetical protein
MDEMKVNAQYMYDFLTAMNWTREAIAGILGNMQSESHINPNIWQGLDEGNLNGGYGIVQWTPATKYLNWCSANSLTPELMESNLSRILYEVENNIQWGNDSFGNPPPYSFAEFTHSTEDPYTLGMYFVRYYERPASISTLRGKQAEEWFVFLGGIKPKRKSKIYMGLGKRRLYIL